MVRKRVSGEADQLPKDSKNSLRVRPLRYAVKETDYALYKAAMEWDLIAPIVIEKTEDLKSTKQWEGKVEPFQHQVSNLINFCKRLPVTLLADDVGLGKTVSAGLVASELISRGRLSKILIVCPKILCPQWEEELRTKFGIESVIATGRELLDAEPPNEIGAVITTYNSARMYINRLRDSGFGMLILDEAHKLRNLHGTDNAPQVALRFKEVLADRVFRYVLLLTATPIQNRLWDLYSLVELLTVARGHENPFGGPGMFARKFIADKKEDARKLNVESQEEFRKIIYGYMSRVRRGDADLHFPHREVELYEVEPTPGERELIDIVGRSIGKMDRLTQINILKTLVSSPEALSKMLKGMAERGNFEKKIYSEVKEVADKIVITSKLRGIEALVDRLRAERPDNWRMVVFTTRIETQTSIENFLEQRGIACGVINGTTGSKNQDTLKKFRKDIPDINVIVSTEAGAEGVNLQVANVLVNYDLPWNPMIVEQRIGRVQRLGSPHEKVCIFNIVLKNTFEQYIVGRLMEKLQMASQAIGDIESLLEASGMGDGEDASEDFEDVIYNLVLASLQGKDVKLATERAVNSVKRAQIQLADERDNINTLLGKMDTSHDKSPVTPVLPPAVYSMEARSFVLNGLESLGYKLTPQTPDLYLAETDKRRELIRFDNNLALPVADVGLFRNVLYAPGSPAFEAMVAKLTSIGLHRIEDADLDLSESKLRQLSEKWVGSIGATYVSSETQSSKRTFSGSAVVRARVTVAHDSYERLVEVPCVHSDHVGEASSLASDPLDPNSILNSPSLVGLSEANLIERATADNAVSEFCRFYNDRLTHELEYVESDAEKIKKIRDEFTPHTEFALVGAEGFLRRRYLQAVYYKFDNNEYSSVVEVLPSIGEIVSSPRLSKCQVTDRMVPEECLSQCDVSKKAALKHLLVHSEISNRTALPEFTVKCAHTGKRVLSDEVIKSDLSGRLIANTACKESAMSHKKGEPNLFTTCEFTGADVLNDEVRTSEVSKKKYRIDEELLSSVSGKLGHKSEFIFCSETHMPILENESEVCEETGRVVRRGLLEECAISKKRVLPSRLERSPVSGKKALSKYFVTSSISGGRMIESEAIKSAIGNFCLPIEARICNWSHKKCHPDDLRTCALTGLDFYLEYIGEKNGRNQFEILSNLLFGILRGSDIEIPAEVMTNLSATLKNKKCKVECNKLSPDKKTSAIYFTYKTFFGFNTNHAGALYSLHDGAVMGRIVTGRRVSGQWEEER